MAKQTAEEMFEERLAELINTETGLNDLVGTIRKSDLLWDFGTIRQLSNDLLGDMSCATGCEKVEDFDANLGLIAKKLILLADALREAKKEARKEKDTVALDCISEAMGEIKGVRREVNALLPEV